MEIALEKVCDLIVHARAFDVKEGMTDPQSGSERDRRREYRLARRKRQRTAARRRCAS